MDVRPAATASAPPRRRRGRVPRGRRARAARADVPEPPADARVRGSRRPDEADADDALRDDRGARHDDAVRRRGRSEERLRARRRAAAERGSWRHDEHGHEDGHAVACAARCRQPRPDPRARRAREQPQGRQHRDPEAPADGVHRRLRLGQELAGVRHDRRGVAAADQRDLQRLRAGLHADAGAARGRRARRADDRDHRRPGADGRRPPLHGRHRHRRQRDAAHPLQPARAAAHRLAQRVLLQRRLGHGRAAGSRSSAATRPRPRRRPSAAPAACARAARAGARSPTSTCPRSTTTASRSTRARSRSPATAWTAGTAASSAAAASSTRTSRSASSTSGSCTTCSTRSRPRSRSRGST